MFETFIKMPWFSIRWPNKSWYAIKQPTIIFNLLFGCVFTYSFSIITSTEFFLVVFHWRLSDNKSSHVFQTPQSIRAKLFHIVVYMVCILPQISNFSILFSKPFVTDPSALVTNGITVTFSFHHIFSSGKIQVFFYLFTFCCFYSVVHKNEKIH